MHCTVLVGDQVRTCRNNGEWFDSAPTWECKNVLVHFNYSKWQLYSW